MILAKLNADSGEPLYLQLMQRIRHAAESGALQDGDQLPSIRALAEGPLDVVSADPRVIEVYLGR